MPEHEPQEPTGATPPAAEPTPPAVDSTGDARIDAALARLDALVDAPVHDHPAVVEDVHRALQDTLAEEQE